MRVYQNWVRATRPDGSVIWVDWDANAAHVGVDYGCGRRDWYHGSRGPANGRSFVRWLSRLTDDRLEAALEGLGFTESCQGDDDGPVGW